MRRSRIRLEEGAATIMHKPLKVLMGISLTVFLVVAPTGRACGETASVGKKPLIVYFSRVGSSKSFQGVDAVSSASLPKGNTIVVANMVHDAVGGDLFQVVTVDPYPASYDATTAQALKEQDANARPKLSTHVPNMADYDTIYLGYPDWWGTLPMPIFTFLEEYDFSGKTIVPFCTHEGSGLGRSERDIAKLCPKAKLLKGLAIRGSSVDRARGEVEAWLAGLGKMPKR
jgi:flavodoxin